MERGDVLQDVVAEIEKTDQKIRLSTIQLECISEVVLRKKHIVATLPTGSGKSMIFIGALLAQNVLSQNGVSILIVPILALMHDHLLTLQKFGIKAMLLQDVVDEKVEYALNESYVVLTFPETLFTHKGKDFVQKISEKISYIIIDEVHLLQSWGNLGGDSKVTFRKCFTRLRELFVKFQVHPTMINLTATLTNQNMNNIMRYLGLRKEETFLKNLQPLSCRVHITIIDEETPFSIAKIFLYLFNNDSPKRIIIFLTSLEDCGALYQDICTEVYGDQLKEITQVITAETESKLKEQIIDDLQETAGKIRLVIATSTLSMGVNIKDAKYVVQLGAPTSFEEFLQKCGRCGREGEMGYALLYPRFKRFHPKTDPQFRNFCRSPGPGCLRQQITKNFPGETVNDRCVNCSHCYDAGQDDILVQMLTKNTAEDMIDSQPPAQIILRTIPRDSKKEFGSELVFLAKKKLYRDFSGTPTIGRPFLTEKTIDEILKRLSFICSENELMDLVEDATLRIEVMSLIQDFFGDVPEQYCSKILLNKNQFDRDTEVEFSISSYYHEIEENEDPENEIDDMIFLG